MITTDQTGIEGSPDRPVHELVHRRAALLPGTTAISWNGEVVSYRDLADRATTVANSLRRIGRVRGAPVAVRMPQGPGRIAALLGVLESGAHLAWLGTGDAGDRGRVVLADLRPTCLLADPVDGDQAGDSLAEWYVTELAGRIVKPGDPDSLRPAPPVSSLPVSAPAVPAPLSERTGLGDWAYVAHTSGSTGRPKGIPQTHGAFAQFVTWFADEFRLGPGARMAQWVAPEHDPALCEVFATLSSGATLCLVPDRIRAHPEKLAGWLADEKITHIQTVPSFAKELLGVIIEHGMADHLTSLGHILLMGEAVPAELANGLRAALPSARLINLYGPTETIAATWHHISGQGAGPVPIGRPIPGRQVLVVDESDRPCPEGTTGEIVILSPYVTPGYVGSATGGDSVFQPLRGRHLGAERTYRTGDLARRRWDGYLEFRGRKDFQVKISGTRLELTEVEVALAAHGSVAECAVLAHTDRDGLADRLIAFVVPTPRVPEQGPVNGATWRAHLRQRFGKDLPPIVFKVLTGRLPRNVMGKIDRRALTELTAQPRQRASQ